jgi:hypothetical protein
MVKWLEKKVKLVELSKIHEIGIQRLYLLIELFFLFPVWGKDLLISGDLSEWVPPNSISNLVVKTLSADDSVDFFHVKVGHHRICFQKPWLALS